MKRPRFPTAVTAMVVAALALPRIALADPPAPTAEGAFEAHVARHIEDVTDLRLQLGGALATGNTQSVAANGALRFLLRRGENQFTMEGGFNYGRGWVLMPPSTMRTAVT